MASNGLLIHEKIRNETHPKRCIRERLHSNRSKSRVGLLVRCIYERCNKRCNQEKKRWKKKRERKKKGVEGVGNGRTYGPTVPCLQGHRVCCARPSATCKWTTAPPLLPHRYHTHALPHQTAPHSTTTPHPHHRTTQPTANPLSEYNLSYTCNQRHPRTFTYW